MRVTAAGLVLLSLAHEAVASGCPIVTPAGAWPQGAIHTAVSAGKPNVSVPPKLVGFNRTVTIDGLCADAFTVSTDFTCGGAGGEFRAGLTAPPAQSPVALRFGAASCPLTAISVYKTAAGSVFEAEMRFSFEGCVDAPVASAAVVVGIRKDATSDFNLMPWTKEVCNIQGATTPPASATVSQETATILMAVGKGQCKAVERRQIANITTETACKLQCVGSSTKAQLLGGVGCTGFSFKAGAKGPNCITYSGSVVAINNKSSDAGWKCFNMSFKNTSYSKSTPPPVVIQKDETQMLYLKTVLGESTNGYLQHISPPADAPTCFTPLWWFTLQDAKGHPQSVPVKEADWDSFMDLIPDHMATASVVSAPVVLDRVIVDTCHASPGWGHQACFVPEVKKTECRQEEVTGAIVSGVITSILTWILVGITFYIYKRSLKGNGSYESLNEPGQGGRFCQSRIVCLLCVTAAGGACISCYVSMKFLEAVLRSEGCYDFQEFLVVILAVVLSVALTIIIILQYMATAHPSHPHPLLGGDKKVERKNTKLVLVEVEDGKSVGNALNTMSATQEGNVFTSFVSGGSGGGTPMMSTMGTGPMNSTGPAAASTPMTSATIVR